MSHKYSHYPDPEFSSAELGSYTEKSPLPDYSHSIEDNLIPTPIDNLAVSHLETLTSVLPIFDSHNLLPNPIPVVSVLKSNIHLQSKTRITCPLCDKAGSFTIKNYSKHLNICSRQLQGEKIIFGIHKFKFLIYS